ncbi:MAG: prepilin-type N-terminal cleavage/methylation domain-containing protein, partial [Planctomycetota bacterium]|nr:prepilin-type N-terminal cleavage/methylation domain-containing protein [Planctomycetota bacterium]
MHRQPTIAAADRRTGFTLVELLMVVLIISLLVAILMPVIISVMKGTTVTKCQQRVSMLNSGAVSYYKDNGFYPGQDTWGKAQLTSPQALTGSQLLALALLGVYTDTSSVKWAASNYIQYELGDTEETFGTWWKYKANGTLAKL